MILTASSSLTPAPAGTGFCSSKQSSDVLGPTWPPARYAKEQSQRRGRQPQRPVAAHECECAGRTVAARGAGRDVLGLDADDALALAERARPGEEVRQGAAHGACADQDDVGLCRKRRLGAMQVERGRAAVVGLSGRASRAKSASALLVGESRAGRHAPASARPSTGRAAGRCCGRDEHGR